MASESRQSLRVAQPRASTGRTRARSVAKRYGIDAGGQPAFHKTWADRARDRKNRVVQRVLVCCRLAEASQDRFFDKKRADNSAAVKKLRAVRKAVATHSQRILDLGIATRRFAGNANSLMLESERPVSVELQFAESSQQFEAQSYKFQHQVNVKVLGKLDERIGVLDRIHSMMVERSNLLVDVDYAKRKVQLEQQRGNINRLADRKRNLDIAQLHYKRATEDITDSLMDLECSTETLVLFLLNEYATILHDHFATSAQTLRGSEVQQAAPMCSTYMEL